MRWEERVAFAVERGRREKVGTGRGLLASENGRGGGSGSGNGNVKVGVGEEEDFSKAPFQYHPPLYGSKGLLPEVEKEKVKVSGVGAERRDATAQDEVEFWMSGADGDGSGIGTGTGPAPPLFPNTLDPSIQSVDMANNASDPNPPRNHFDDLMNDDSNDDLGGASPAPAAVPGIFDTEIQDILDGTYPFESEPPLDFPMGEDFTTDPNASTQHLSFDNYGLQDSFEPGTQDGGETQIASRAKGEFEEFMDRPAPTSTNRNDAAQHVTDDVSSTGYDFDLGSSILGKRKTPPAHASAPMEKRQGRAGVPAFAEVPESFGVDGSAYLLDLKGGGREGDVPRGVVGGSGVLAAEEGLRGEIRGAVEEEGSLLEERG